MTCPMPEPRRQLGARGVVTFLLGIVLLISIPISGGPAAIAASPLNTPAAGGGVVEILRVKVPAPLRHAWQEAEADSWDPWLREQQGFVDRKLYWDPVREEGTVLIHWDSRAAWKAIPANSIEDIQNRFETQARLLSGQGEGNPFPLVFEGELLPL